jgi:hypothetical protein
MESKAEKCHNAREAFIHQGLQRLAHREKCGEKVPDTLPNAALYQAEPQPEIAYLQRDMTDFSPALLALVT